MIFLSGLSYDVGFELGIRIVGVTTEGSSLLQKLKDVDHQYLL